MSIAETVVEDDLPVPVDDQPSRLRKPRGPVTSFTPPADENPDDIASLDDKLAEFHERFPLGRIVTGHRWIELDGYAPMVEATARVWRAEDDEDYAVSATANRTPGEDPEPYGLRPTETAESVAISRALRFLGITGRPTDSKES